MVEEVGEFLDADGVEFGDVVEFEGLEEEGLQGGGGDRGVLGGAFAGAEGEGVERVEGEQESAAELGRGGFLVGDRSGELEGEGEGDREGLPLALEVVVRECG